MEALLRQILSDLHDVKVGMGLAIADSELDGKYGDPQVKFNPRDWHGEDQKGRTFSACPPEFLELLASSYDYFAKMNDEKGEKDSKGGPKSKWDRKSALLARGWAARLRRQGVSTASVDAIPEDF